MWFEELGGRSAVPPVDCLCKLEQSLAVSDGIPCLWTELRREGKWCVYVYVWCVCMYMCL